MNFLASLVASFLLSAGVLPGQQATQNSAATAPSFESGVIPRPRQIERLSGRGFSPGQAFLITFSDTAPDRFAAMLLRDTLREVGGVDCELLSSKWTSTDPHQLRVDAHDAGAPVEPSLQITKKSEGYGLT